MLKLLTATAAAASLLAGPVWASSCNLHKNADQAIACVANPTTEAELKACNAAETKKPTQQKTMTR
jgi:hypothetical protein